MKTISGIHGQAHLKSFYSISTYPNLVNLVNFQRRIKQCILASNLGWLVGWMELTPFLTAIKGHIMTASVTGGGNQSSWSPQETTDPQLVTDNYQLHVSLI